MKPSLDSCLFTLLLAACLALMPAALRADTSQPLFGGHSLDIHGSTYTWESASEDGAWHYDFYTGDGGTVTVTGMIGFPNLASVSGGGIDGHLNHGSYADNAQSWSDEGDFEVNGHWFTHCSGSAEYYPDLAGGQLLSSGSYSYSGPSGGYSYVWDSAGGWSWSLSISGSDSAGSSPSSGHSGIELFGTTYSFTHNDSSWSQESGGDSTGHSWSNGGSSTWSDHYVSADGGWMTLGIGQSTDGIVHTSLSGWDPLAGSFSASQSGTGFSGLEGLSWELRTGPSFAPAQLWLNGTLVNWQWGEITLQGVVTDHYEQDGLTLVLSGPVREFHQGTSHAVFTVNGGSQGTLDGSGFHGSDWSIQTYEPEPDPGPDPGPDPVPDPDPDPGIPESWTDALPFFTGTASLWVDGTEYPFFQGYQDDSGHRTDTYMNSSVGAVTLIGSTGDASYAEVQVSHFGGMDYGYYSSGWFQTYTYGVSTSPPADPGPEPDPNPDPNPDPDPVPDPGTTQVYGPDALWVRGRLYSRESGGSTAFHASSEASLQALSNDYGISLEISGADAQGDFTGSIPATQAGIHFISSGAGLYDVPVIPANGDGSLQLSGEEPDASLPPALMVSGRGIWQHLGTLEQDGAHVAWYGNALGVSGTDPAQGGGQLLSIRLGGGPVVTLVDHRTGGSTATGSYSTTTHLFQTGVQNSLPMPIYGVDPTANHVLWGMAQPGDGRPATFVVGDAVWRFIGVDATGAALYQGYFTGQMLALGQPGADGLVLVAVTDPVRGNTTGTLNGVRGSARLRNGAMVYSGDMQGARLQPVLNDNSLHTIAASLDITGNLLTLGHLSGDAATAGAMWQFNDNGGTALLGQALGRGHAQWQWLRVHPQDVGSHVPSMALDSGWGLALYDPANPAQATIKLNPNPAAGSSFKGPLRVAPAGDIGMGEFTNGPQP